MKKIKTLFVPLMACSLLVGCGGGGDKPEALKFSVTDASVEYESTEATVKLDWTPSDHSLKFADFNFTCDEKEITKVEQTGDLSARPAEVTITFKDKLITSITGALSFHYADNTTKTEGEETIEGINIRIAPPTPEITSDGGIDLTYMRMNAARGSTVKFSYDTNKGTDLKVYWGDGTVDSSSEHTYTNPGRYSIYITGNINNIALANEEGLISDDNSNITSIILSNHVTTISAKAFQLGKLLTDLKSVFIPKTVTTIGDGAFNTDKVKYYFSENKWGDNWNIGENCIVTPYTNLYIDTNGDKILYAVYDDGTEQFASVYICCNLELEEINIAEQIEISETNQTYPVTSLWDSAFYDMPTLKEVQIPDSVKNIENNVFINCKNLWKVILGNGVESIGDYAFKNTAIKEITIPSSIKVINSYAFESCHQLEKVEFEGGDNFAMPQYGFIDCPNINEVILGEGVTGIEMYAIASMKVKEIVLPKSIKNMSLYAVTDCKLLETIDATKFTSTDKIPVINDGAFRLSNPGNVVTIKIASNLKEENFTSKHWPSSNDPTSATIINYVNI